MTGRIEKVQFWRAVLLSFLVLLSAFHGSFGDDRGVPDRKLLKARVHAFYEAMSTLDSQALLQILTPETSRCSSVADIARDLRAQSQEGDRILSWKIEAIEPEAQLAGEREIECTHDHIVISAAAIVVTTVKSERGGQRRKVGNLRHVWVYVDGQWYWLFHDPD